jgi:putative ABC transport system permease protein
VGTGGRRGLVTVVSHQYWQRRFNRDASVLGSTIRINGQAATVVGIAPEAFRGTRVGSLPDVFVPMTFATSVFADPNWLTNPRNNWLRVIARVPAEARAEAGMTAAFRRFNRDIILPLTAGEEARQALSARSIRLEPGQAGLLEIENVKPTLFALLGLVSLVLLMACVNVASLMAARAERLRRQTAIAIALGATHARVWRQCGLESVVVAAFGLGLGLVVALWMRGILLRLVPGRQEIDVVMDVRILTVSVVVGLATALVLALVTAYQATRVGVVGALKGTDHLVRFWFRKGLTVPQFALSVLVLVAASLFTRTLGNLRAVDAGFDQEHVLIASTATDGYSPERRDAFYAALVQQIRAVPGVISVALANDEPLRTRTSWSVCRRQVPGAHGR